MRLQIKHRKPMLPEGSHVLFVKDVEINEKSGFVSIHFITANDGPELKKRYYFLKSNGEFNDIGLIQLSELYNAATGDNEAKDMDPEELIGKYVHVDCVHREYEYNGRTNTSVELNNPEPVLDREKFEIVDGFVESSYTNPNPAPTATAVDLGL